MESQDMAEVVPLFGERQEPTMTITSQIVIVDPDGNEEPYCEDQLAA